jgi:hypothetical protein
MSLVYIVYVRLFSFHPQASDVGETHSLVPGTVTIKFRMVKIYTVLDKLDGFAEPNYFLILYRRISF